MSVRALAIVVTVLVSSVVLGLVVEDPDILSSAVGRVADGGMWTALALFLAAALVVGLRRGGAR